MRVNELIGAQLDHWVARANGWTFGPPHKIHEFDVWRDSAGKITGTIPAQAYKPSKNWDQGGLIMGEHAIGFHPISDAEWLAEEHVTACTGRGPTPLIAAMRAYVASKFGDEVQEGSESNG